jgi:hypothetical protein
MGKGDQRMGASMRRIKIILVSLFLAIAAHGQALQRIAIINTEDDGEPSIGILEQANLTAKLREVANGILPKERYGVMTQQSIVDRLGSQERAVKECRESTCLADLGRKVNADFIAQARIGRFGGNLTIRTELYNVASGNLIASFTGDSKDVLGLLSVLDAKAPDLFKTMLPKAGAAPAIEGGVTFVKRYAVNLNTDPKKALLSFNGVPNSSCTRTPCKAELPEGLVRIVAALEQYETADTSIFIKAENNQSINIKLKPNFGVLNIKPAYFAGIGADKEWRLTINGKKHSSFKNNLSPDSYDVKLSHECYDEINFKVGINKGSDEILDMAKYVQVKQGKTCEAVSEKQAESPKSDLHGNSVKLGLRAGFNAYDFYFGYEGLNEGKHRGKGAGAGLALKVPLAGLLSLSMGLDFYYRQLFTRDVENDVEVMSEFAVSIPVLFQLALTKSGNFNLAAGAQFDYPFNTKWADYYDYFTENRRTFDLGAVFGMVYMAGPSIGVDLRCIIDLYGLFYGFDSPYVMYNGSNSYVDKSSLMQYGVGVIYFF